MSDEVQWFVAWSRHSDDGAVLASGVTGPYADEDEAKRYAADAKARGLRAEAYGAGSLL